MIECKKHIEELYQKGACTPSLDEKNFLTKFKIPLPSAEIQERVVDYYDDCDKKIKFFTESIEFTNKFIKTTTEMNLICYSNECEVRQLKDCVNIIKCPKTVASKFGNITGQYPLYYCSILGNLYLDTYDYDEEALFINKTNGSAKWRIYYTNGKHSVGETTIKFASFTENVLNKYVYYYLSLERCNEEISEKKFKGAQQYSIVDEDLLSYKIMVPPIEIQKRIIEENDLLENSIKNSEFMRSKHAELRKDKFHILLSKKYNQMVHGDPA